MIFKWSIVISQIMLAFHEFLQLAWSLYDYNACSHYEIQLKRAGTEIYFKIYEKVILKDSSYIDYFLS